MGQGVMIPSGGMDGVGITGPFGGMSGGGGGNGPLNGSPHGGGNGGQNMDEDMTNNNNNNIEPNNGEDHNVEETESLMSEQAVKVRPPAKFFVGKPQKFQTNNKSK